MKKFYVKCTPSEDGARTFKVSLEDIGCTQEEFDAATDEEKRAWVQSAIDNEPEQPYWYVDSFEEI